VPPTPREPRWVDRLVVEAAHLDLIRAFGGMPGLRDEHALEAALARPRQHFAYEPEADLLTLAAAYAHGLAANHPFVDGNKRIAFLTMAVFLGLNGVDLTATESEVLTVMLDLASGGLDVSQLEGWLRTRTAPRPPTR
jgi:death on curing protein